MKNKLQNNGGSCGAETTPSQFIKLGLDVHADSISVARIVDGQAPQPAQRFTPERFLIWVEKQKAQASKVFACYEAGPFGYSLYVAIGMSTLRASRPTPATPLNWRSAWTVTSLATPKRLP